MSRHKIQSRFSRAFYSMDAAFALLTAVTAYALFALLLSSAAQSASSSAGEQSKSLLALRLSSYILEDAGIERGGLWGGSYSKRSELDLLRLRLVNLGEVRLRLGVEFASISVSDGADALFRSESGTPQGEVFCASRIALVSKKIVKLQACIS